MLAKGINFQIGDGGGPEVFHQILNITSFKLDGTKWSTEKTTNHNDATPVETFQPTIRSDGTITLTLSSYIPGNTYHALLRTLSLSGAAHNFKITYPGSALGSFAFSGFVTGFIFDTPVDGLMKANITIMVSGTITDEPASVTSLVVTDTIPSHHYVTANVVRLSAIFDEVVNITGTPRVSITFASGTVHANYVSGSGTNVLAFSYTVQVADNAELTNFAIVSPLDLNGGTVKDVAGQAAVLTFTPPNTSTYTVNP